ncbi:NUDIX domain-containing protein [Lactobacillus sp. ESL0236]|uniref:NUDIX domain-containing protein n=1 Tax=unclassified Lactobacillus TaxID=2620435 RepID=UPI000EFBC803|nr:NUDIX domain-containing protein [Lactobacillus sp. ESL0237]RMC43124.1 NUDIX domain-containing protein [Lactobacillus sp. ESL0234]RMC43978.1 NUDIX domain-containing protein [Lactobacillus sp. ESL0236]
MCPTIKAVLLIHRINKRDYWVVPGGRAHKGEAASETALRELKEELGIKLAARDLTLLYQLDQDEKQIFFKATTKLIRAPLIQGEERKWSSSTNIYHPEWVKLKDIAKINLMPPQIAARLATGDD